MSWQEQCCGFADSHECAHSMSQLVFTVVTANPSFDQLETGTRLQTEICQSCRQTSDAVCLGASHVVTPLPGACNRKSQDQGFARHTFSFQVTHFRQSSAQPTPFCNHYTPFSAAAPRRASPRHSQCGSVRGYRSGRLPPSERTVEAHPLAWLQEVTSRGLAARSHVAARRLGSVHPCARAELHCSGAIRQREPSYSGCGGECCLRGYSCCASSALREGLSTKRAAAAQAADLCLHKPTSKTPQ